MLCYTMLISISSAAQLFWRWQSCRPKAISILLSDLNSRSYRNTEELSKCQPEFEDQTKHQIAPTEQHKMETQERLVSTVLGYLGVIYKIFSFNWNISEAFLSLILLAVPWISPRSGVCYCETCLTDRGRVALKAKIRLERGKLGFECDSARPPSLNKTIRQESQVSR